MLRSVFTYLMFFGIPLAALGFWVVSMLLYFPAKKQEKQVPGSVEPSKLRTYKFMFIVSSVIAGILLTVVVGFMALMFMAVAFM